MHGRDRMANTFFFREASKSDSKITWKDIFSDTFKKHSKAEMEYALSAGTQLNTATRDTMLKKWQKPWIWARVLGGGIAICVLLYLAYAVPLNLLHSYLPAILLLNMFFPPFVSAFAVMTLLWELNIPRNISIYSMLGYFMVGGVMSLVLTQFFNAFGKSLIGDSPAAPLTEEPAKCLAAFAFLVLASKSKRIYGLTGLAIGAGVGAGFTAFESVQYAFTWTSTVEDALALAIERSIPKIGGHILYCAPYAAGLALAYAVTRDWKKVWTRKEFWIPYILSTLGHAAWNYNASYIGSDVIKWIIAFAMWYEVLYMTRKCLTQAVRDGMQGSGGYSPAAHRPAPQIVSGVLTLSCIGGSLAGGSWHFSRGVFSVGSDAASTIRFQDRGVSGNHLKIERLQSGWTVTDLGSTYGTYLSSGRINPGMRYPLRSGETVYLGSNKTAFRVHIS